MGRAGGGGGLSQQTHQWCLIKVLWFYGVKVWWDHGELITPKPKSKEQFFVCVSRILSKHFWVDYQIRNILKCRVEHGHHPKVLCRDIRSDKVNQYVVSISTVIPTPNIEETVLFQSLPSSKLRLHVPCTVQVGLDVAEPFRGTAAMIHTKDLQFKPLGTISFRVKLCLRQSTCKKVCIRQGTFKIKFCFKVLIRKYASQKVSLRWNFA